MKVKRLTAILFAAAQFLLFEGLASQVFAAGQFQTHAPGVLKDNHGQGAPDYSSYAPGIRFPIINFPTTLNSQIRNKGGGAIGGDQCDPGNFNEVWHDTLCETRGRKAKPPLSCPLKTTHQGVDIRGGTAVTCRTLRQGRQNLIPVVAVKDGTIKKISTYTVHLSINGGDEYRYLHMNMRGLKVTRGQNVKAGDVIGFMYNDFGGTPTTFHLHLEHWKNIAGHGFIPVPLYCDLITAYERDQGKTSTMIDGGQRCEGSSAATVAVQPPTPSTPGDTSKVTSYWKFSGSEVGLVADGASREFLFTSPASSGGVKAGDRVFIGRKEGERYAGRARVWGDGCGNAEFDASGPILDGGKKVELSGTRIKQGASCTLSGSEQVTMRFEFLRKRGEGDAVASCGATLDRQSKTELTRNWGAITMYVPWDSWLSYIKLWPGLKLGSDGKPIDVQVDRFGGSIMAFESDESGVGIWWYWLLVRKGFGKDGIAMHNPTFLQIAKGIAGETAPPASINNYVNAYTVLSEQYFGRRLDQNDPIAISDADERWALASTMFHHEAGRTPLIDRATFERGIQFGTDFMAGAFKGKQAYLPPCAEQPGPVAIGPAGTDDRDQQIQILQETNARLNEMIADLQRRLEEIGKMASQ
ncbi:M23 family metallopeptidase [Sinorhizobium meliloti]|uniref:M23 family metallopeptidase n=1 Tax=Rhizobium meliloti TaxID=382 RepID=UPI000696350A|nr:M23 family metallopeptidase [Sinorhizobium meliloti]